MQSRKELADAGRRKLEEFRKAKAQGKLPVPAGAVKPVEGAQASAPSSKSPPVVFANGNGYTKPSVPPGDSTLSPTGPIPATVPVAAPTAALTTRPPAAPPPIIQHLPLEADAPAVLTPTAPPSSAPAPAEASTASAPVTTFVVLQNAPIPFGASPPPAGPPGRVSSNGFVPLARTSSSGLKFTYAAPSHAVDGVLHESGGSGDGKAAALLAGVNPPPLAAALAASGDGQSGARPWEPPQQQWQQHLRPRSASQDAHREHDTGPQATGPTAGSFGAVSLPFITGGAPQHAAVTSGAGQDLFQGHIASAPAALATGLFGPAASSAAPAYASSYGQDNYVLQLEGVPQSESATRAEAAPFRTGAADTRPTSSGWTPTVSDGQGAASSQSAVAGPADSVRASTVAPAWERTSRLHPSEPRTSWLTPTTAGDAAPLPPPIQTVAAVAGPPHHIPDSNAVAQGPGATTSAPQPGSVDATQLPRSGPPADAAAATAIAATTARTEVSNGYDQLSDSYLGVSSSTPVAASSEPAVGSFLSPGGPVASEPGGRGEDGAEARAAAAIIAPSPPLPVSFSAASPGVPGFAAARSTSDEPAAVPSPPPAKAAPVEEQAKPASPQQPSPPSKPSRFAWLFGSPPPAKQQAPQPTQPPPAPQLPTATPQPAAVPSPPTEQPAAPPTEPSPSDPLQPVASSSQSPSPHAPTAITAADPWTAAPLAAAPPVTQSATVTAAPSVMPDPTVSYGAPASTLYPTSQVEGQAAGGSFLDVPPAATAPPKVDGSRGQAACSAPYNQDVAYPGGTEAEPGTSGALPRPALSFTSTSSAPPAATAAAATTATTVPGVSAWEGYSWRGDALGSVPVSAPSPGLGLPSHAATPSTAAPGWLGSDSLVRPWDRSGSSAAAAPALGGTSSSTSGLATGDLGAAALPSFLRADRADAVPPVADSLTERTLPGSITGGGGVGGSSLSSSFGLSAAREGTANPVDLGTASSYAHAVDAPSAAGAFVSSVSNLSSQVLPPRPPIPPNSAASNFAAAASYLSAYSASSSAAPHSAVPYGGDRGGGAAAAAAAAAPTSSFLDSYLDNLLSDMAAAKEGGGGEDKPGSAGAGGPHANGGAVDHSHPSGPSISGTPRTSYPGESAAAAGAHASEVASWQEEAADQVAGLGGANGDRESSSGDWLGGGGGAGGGGGGRGGALLHVDSSGQLLRGHHSRRQSVDSAGVLSVYSHATGLTNHAANGSHGGHGYGGGGGNIGVSRAQFSALQQHIDELTEEKLVLSRGLSQQVRINEQLAEENEELTRQYNARGNMVEELQRKIKQYEQELEAQALSLEGFSEERQAARTSYTEASSRAQALASEVVGLEAQVLQLKSAVLKAERAAEEAQQRARKLEKQVESLTKEATSRSQELQQMQLKGRNLVVMLKQTEAKLQAAEEKLALQQHHHQQAARGPGGLHAVSSSSSLLANGHVSLAAKPDVLEREVQCDLAAELAEAAAAAAEAEAAEAAAAQGGWDAGGAGGARRLMRSDSISSGTDALAPTDSAGRDSQLALAVPGRRQPSHAGDSPEGPGHRARSLVDWSAARPQRDAPSAVVADRALAPLDKTALLRRALGQSQGGSGEGLAEGLDAVALQLARWLPAGPISGVDPVAVMAEEELRLMQSIHDLLGGFEQAQEETVGRMMELQDRVASLMQENDELRHKLELQTQRLELQTLQGMHYTGAPLSLHQTPTASVTDMSNAALAATTPDAEVNNCQTPHAHSAAGPADILMTPTRAMRTVSGNPADLFGTTSPIGAPGRQSWMGYLFRSRQKKRVRSAIL